jgi:hypothetical protein
MCETHRLCILLKPQPAFFPQVPSQNRRKGRSPIRFRADFRRLALGIRTQRHAWRNNISQQISTPLREANVTLVRRLPARKRPKASKMEKEADVTTRRVAEWIPQLEAAGEGADLPPVNNCRNPSRWTVQGSSGRRRDEGRTNV